MFVCSGVETGLERSSFWVSCFSVQSFAGRISLNTDRWQGHLIKARLPGPSKIDLRPYWSENLSFGCLKAASKPLNMAFNLPPCSLVNAEIFSSSALVSSCFSIFCATLFVVGYRSRMCHWQRRLSTESSRIPKQWRNDGKTVCHWEITIKGGWSTCHVWMLSVCGTLILLERATLTRSNVTWGIYCSPASRDGELFIFWTPSSDFSLSSCLYLTNCHRSRRSKHPLQGGLAAIWLDTLQLCLDGGLPWPALCSWNSFGARSRTTTPSITFNGVDWIASHSSNNG